MTTEIHVSDFPPHDDGEYVSRGWDGEVNEVEDVTTGDVYLVNHGDPDPEPQPAITPADGDGDGEESEE